MECPFCQNQVDDTLPVCPHCGASVSGLETQATPSQAETISAPMPRPRPGQPPQGASKRALFLNFNEKPGNIVQVMDEARRQEGEFAESYRQQVRILAWLLPAGLLFLLLDGIMNRSFHAFTLVACVLWAAVLLGVVVLRRDWPVRKEEKAKAPAAVILGRGCNVLFVTFWLALLLGMLLASIDAFSFLARNPLLVVALVLAGAALVSLTWLRRTQPGSVEFGPRFDAAHILFETLKDDVAPKRTSIGWLDLTGAQQPGKLFREKTSASGSPVKYYRDEWLRIKMRLYDGNVLRVSAVERVKAKLGRWKKSRSGKRKWKPGGTPQARNELQVMVAVNPEAYQVLPIQDGQVGRFLVAAPPTADGRLVLRASTNAAIDGADILRVLRFAYDHVKPRAMPPGAEEVAEGV